MKQQIPSRSHNQTLQVAAPWGLSHYIALNGFHPLYRALVDYAPDDIRVLSWDNVSLYEALAKNHRLRYETVEAVRRQEQDNRKRRPDELEKKYQAYFWPPNQILTEQLPGEIELHHTAPFPSMTRPFVFHCESFAPIFFPFTQQGSGRFEHHAQLREHYRRIFANPLCLGIFSHIPETLNGIRRFFGEPDIDRKLFPSRIGLSETAFADAEIDKPPLTEQARFLFVNSANQNPDNFFRRGGHIVLRFWERFRRDGHRGLLMLRCARPSDADLRAYGVDADFVTAETGGSVIWAQDYLSNREMNALMTNAHFFLLPSNSLHSASIMQSMWLGAIPVLSDAIGVEQYVRDEENGIVLEGIRKALWQRDPETGVLVDRYRRTPELDAGLAEQMYARIRLYLHEPEQCQALRIRAQRHAETAFSGKAFSRDFWRRVKALHARYEQETAKPSARSLGAALHGTLLADSEWQRVFESATQPLLKLFTGSHRVWELGGSSILMPYDSHVRLNDLSAVAQYIDRSAPTAVFSKDIKGLAGGFLPKPGEGVATRRNLLVRCIARVLRPYSRLHGFAAGILKRLRRMRIHFVRRGRYIVFKYRLRPSITPDIELIFKEVYGHNVVRFFHRYYGLPQGVGAFQPSDEVSGRYRIYPCALFADAVTRVIARRANRQDQRAKDAYDVCLVREGVHRFNVVRVNRRFYAILQAAGEFDMEKVKASRYEPIFESDSLEEIQGLIDQYRKTKRRKWWR